MSIYIMIGILLIANLFLCSSDKRITWSGQQWIVKSGDNIGPGPNSWSSDNVFVDSDGNLHLQITYNRFNGEWECAALYTVNKISFGTYQWWIDSSLEFDKNVVLGLFTYGQTDRQNEIDIEFSKWGDANRATNANYNVYPSDKQYSNTPSFWNIDVLGGGGTYTTQRFKWNSRSIEFWAIAGHYNIGREVNVLNNWKFAPSDYTNLIPQTSNMKLHMNLWLFRGNAPSNNRPVEVVIRGFQSDN